METNLVLKPMLIDNSVEDINIRIHTRKEKYIYMKNKLQITPTEYIECMKKGMRIMYMN